MRPHTRKLLRAHAHARSHTPLHLPIPPTTAQFPRRLETTYKDRPEVGSVTDVVVALTNVGTYTYPIERIELILEGVAGGKDKSVPIFDGKKTKRAYACPSLNNFPLPLSLLTGPDAERRIKGVRVIPFQGRVRDSSRFVMVGVPW